MSVLTTPLSIVGLLSVLFMMFMLANLSRRLGAVTKMKPRYQLFYVAMGLLSVALMARLIRNGVVSADGSCAAGILCDPLFYLLTYHLPFAIAVTLGLVAAWRYWGWLFRESHS